MKEQLLEIDVRLLILRYGRLRVLDVLARLGEQTLEEIEHELRATEQKPKRGRSKKQSLTEIVTSECLGRPEIADPLRTIALNYENRMFLPHLRDVQHFLARIGTLRGKLKSRTAAGSILIRALAKLPNSELLKIATRKDSSGESDYSLLSRAIMGTPRSNRRDPD